MRVPLIKLRGLLGAVEERLSNPKSRYFDPAIVSELFERYTKLAAEIRAASPEYFDDLPVREMPAPSGTSDYQGRGYIERPMLERLRGDIDYVLKVAGEMPVDERPFDLFRALGMSGAASEEASTSAPKPTPKEPDPPPPTPMLQKFFTFEATPEKAIEQFDRVVSTFLSSAKTQVSLHTENHTYSGRSAADAIREISLLREKLSLLHLNSSADGKSASLVLQYSNDACGRNGNCTLMLGSVDANREVYERLRVDLSFGESLIGNTAMIGVPASLHDSLRSFRKDYPTGTRTAFLMMKFDDSPMHRGIVSAIRASLKNCGVAVLRADDKEYSDDLWANVATYMYGCEFGLAVFDRIRDNYFNPNVSYEIGYMQALGKRVCLLKDCTLDSLQTDLVGKLYREFDPQRSDETLPTVLEKWMRDRGLAA